MVHVMMEAVTPSMMCVNWVQTVQTAQHVVTKMKMDLTFKTAMTPILIFTPRLWIILGMADQDCDGQDFPGLCEDTCTYAHDGACDDGGPSAEYSLCPLDRTVQTAGQDWTVMEMDTI